MMKFESQGHANTELCAWFDIQWRKGMRALSSFNLSNEIRRFKPFGGM
jgi:hypothetical protein